MPSNLKALLQRIKSRNFTDEDITSLEEFFNGASLQDVSQDGKYNVNTGHGSLSIGDHYGPSIEDIRAIVQAMQPLQLQSSAIEVEQAELTPDNVPLALLSFESELVERINSRLIVLEELRKAEQLPGQQQIGFNKVKRKVCSVMEMRQDLAAIANDADNLLQDAVKALTQKLRELDRSQGDNLLEARSRVCLQQQIEALERFQEDLRYGKTVAYWLDYELKQGKAKKLGEAALEAFPEIKEDLSPRKLDIFYLSVEQFLERLSHCLIWGRTNSLEDAVTPVILNDEVYTKTFESLKSSIPETLPKDGIEQLHEYIDFLIEHLPTYQHLDVD